MVWLSSSGTDSVAWIMLLKVPSGTSAKHGNMKCAKRWK